MARIDTITGAGASGPVARGPVATGPAATGPAATGPATSRPFTARPGSAGAILSVAGLGLRYPDGKQALCGMDVDVRAGELVVILGSNGCGKSTLLRCIVRLLQPGEGRITAAGHDMIPLQGKALRRARMSIGMVGQSANLVRRRSVLANVVAGTLARHRGLSVAAGLLPRQETEPAMECLSHVGLAEFALQRAGTLSGGQAQRVAVARALAQRPELMLADEPVASLDPESAEEVMRLLRRLADEGLAVVCVLHQPELARRYGDRIVGMTAGRAVFDAAPAALTGPDFEQLYGRKLT